MKTALHPERRPAIGGANTKDIAPRCWQRLHLKVLIPDHFPMCFRSFLQIAIVTASQHIYQSVLMRRASTAIPRGSWMCVGRSIPRHLRDWVTSEPTHSLPKM